MAESTGMKGLVGRKMSLKTKFVGQEILINKLTVAQVLEIQELAQAQTEGDNGFDLLKRVIRMSADGAADLSDEDFNDFPMDELSSLSEAIMKFSGIGDKTPGK